MKNIDISKYRARIGCWNCDSVYSILIKKGTNTPEFLVNKGIVCRNCGCKSMKMYNEYKVEKKIMKDVMLHAKIEHMSNMPPPNIQIKKHDHHHIG